MSSALDHVFQNLPRNMIEPVNTLECKSPENFNISAVEYNQPLSERLYLQRSNSIVNEEGQDGRREKDFNHMRFPSIPGIISQIGLDLEDAVGSSLASAINSLDINCNESESSFSNPCSTEFKKPEPSCTPMYDENTMPFRIPQSAPPFPHYHHRSLSNISCYPAINPKINESVKTILPKSFIFQELTSFFTNYESHALIICNLYNISSNQLKNLCEMYGEIYYWKDEFLRNFGVVFIAFFDLRVSVTAHAGLAHDLYQLGLSLSSVHFSISLHSAVNYTLSSIVIFNVPNTVKEVEVAEVCQNTGGDVRYVFTKAFNEQFNEIHVEFFNIEAMQLALKQLPNYLNSIWGMTIMVEVPRRNEHEHLLSLQLYSLVERWHSLGSNLKPPSFTKPLPSSYCNNSSPCVKQTENSLFKGTMFRYFRGHSEISGITTPETTPSSTPPSMFDFSNYDDSGRRSCEIPLQQSNHLRSSSVDHIKFHNQSINPYDIEPSYRFRGYSGCKSGGYLSHFPEPIKLKNERSISDCSDMDFSLDLHRIASGVDKRTTIMIRNIPNKYTQAMLLQEIDVNYFETYDFFYLPIDFKNKCNVGYAFMNFIDYRKIIHFTREFHGQRWRNFNSEKVCAIAYARIQGKASMINRFQNSSLMEKDNEYRPLIFCSVGPKKGQPESFPLNRKCKKDVNLGII